MMHFARSRRSDYGTGDAFLRGDGTNPNFLSGAYYACRYLLAEREVPVLSRKVWNVGQYQFIRDVAGQLGSGNSAIICIGSWACQPGRQRQFVSLPQPALLLAECRSSTSEVSFTELT